MNRYAYHFDGKPIVLDVVTSPAEQERGLMSTPALSCDKGMLFVFPDVKQRAMWMKGMRYPIDIAFLRNGYVVRQWEHVHPNIQNLSYPSGDVADAAIELPAGWLSANKITKGSRLTADPIVQHVNNYSTIAGTDAGFCTPQGLGRIVWPSTVQDFKNRINPLFVSTNEDVQKCVGLSPDQISSWSSFYASWQKFLAEEEPTWGAGSRFDDACGFSRTLDAWRNILDKQCKLSGPLPNDIPGNTDTGVQTTTKWIIAGVIVISAAVVLSSYAPEIKELLPKRKD